MQNTVKLFLVVVLFSTFSIACKKTNPRQIKMMDELDLVIDSTREALSIDLITLNNRSKRIQFHLNLFPRFYNDTFTLELGNKLTKYKEIAKVYHRFITHYDDIYNRMKTLEHQSETLRNSVEDHKLSKEEFKTYYYDELSKAQENLNEARKYAEFIPKLEPDFQRLHKDITSVLAHVAKSDSTLNQLLTSEYAND